MKYFAFSLSFFIAIIVSLTFAVAQPGDTPPGGGPFPAAPTAVPIDGGLAILAAAGAAYGAKKIRDYRKNQQEQEAENIEI
ncbi:MAG: hypothetical protein JJT94_05400 [Bernardetiaceae bacterium]|nr:hypothetical protein [Bernardetiaceae bacterium]